MYKQEVLGDSVLVQIIKLEEKEEGVIELLDQSTRLSRFSPVIGIGSEVKSIKIGDDVLIPEKEAGRVIFPLEGREYAIFPESSIKIKREKLV